MILKLFPLHFSFRINFDDPTMTRAAALAKSAVLAALEEEEREKAGQKPGEWMDIKSKLDRITLWAKWKNPFANIFLLKLPGAYTMLSNGLHYFLHSKCLHDSMEYVMCVQCFPCKKRTRWAANHARCFCRELFRRSREILLPTLTICTTKPYFIFICIINWNLLLLYARSGLHINSHQ